MTRIDRLLDLLATKGGDALFALKNEPWILPMVGSTQTPTWHRECPRDRRLPLPGSNDVFNHTWLVLHYSDRLAHQVGLDEADRLILLLAALFHDTGKPPTRRIACRGDGEQHCREVFLTEQTARHHARTSGHPFDPLYIRNLGHDAVSTTICRDVLADWAGAATVAAIVAAHIAVGAAAKDDVPEGLIADLRRHCPRLDLLTLHYWADKAGGMAADFPAGLFADDLPERIARLQTRLGVTTLAPVPRAG